MLAVEAARLRDILVGQGRPSPLLNLGSSTRRFREVDKPHVERDLFAPLRHAGVEIVHSDIKADDGVDMAGDVLDPNIKRALSARRFRCVLAANLFEHVRDRDAVAAAVEDIAGEGGLILATAPRSYPYHADPIDTYYRPSPTELAGLFGRSRPILVEEIVGPTYREALRGAGSTAAAAVAGTLAALAVAPVRPRSFASKAHRWLWYSRPYRVSVALLQVS
jgi:hypothetical protein